MTKWDVVLRCSVDTCTSARKLHICHVSFTSGFLYKFLEHVSGVSENFWTACLSDIFVTTAVYRAGVVTAQMWVCLWCDYDYGECCVREFKLKCRGIGVHPPLQLSHQVIHFKATALFDTSIASVLVLNNHLDKSLFKRSVPRIGTGKHYTVYW